jgi:hypothetical protein
MMRAVSDARGDRSSVFFLGDEDIDVDGVRVALRDAARAGKPVCVAGTAFAFVALVDALAGDGASHACAPGSRVMETGGFKGRSRVVERGELYDAIAALLHIPKEAIVAEYGMTELTSQWYDAPASRASEPRSKAGPPWMRALIVDAEGREVAPGAVGFLRHVDLANRSSVTAVQTEDRGYATADGFVLLGRDLDAPLRGCSLDAEQLVSRRG